MGSLWGTYDEAANAASFKDAVARRSGEPSAGLSVTFTDACLSVSV